MASAAKNPGRPKLTVVGFDPAAMLGLLATTGLIFTAVFLGGTPHAFIDLPSILLVIFGTMAVTMVSFTLAECANTPLIIGQALSLRKPASSHQVAHACLLLANQARSMPRMALANEIGRHLDKPVLARGLAMLSDGLEQNDILSALRLEIAARHDAQHGAQQVLRRAAEVAPAMGLIGTLIGLVQMLGQLDDPSAIGPSMAVALLTTLYGAFLAHAVLTPLAERLSGRNEQESKLMELQLLTVHSLAEEENPRLLETRLNGLLPPSSQLAFFD